MNHDRQVDPLNVDGVTPSSDQSGMRNIIMAPCASLYIGLSLDDLSEDQGIYPDEIEELAASVVRKYKEESRLTSLETALYPLWESLGLRPADHAFHLDSLENLALALLVKSLWVGDVSTVEEALALICSKLTGVTLPRHLLRAKPEIEVAEEQEPRDDCNNQSYDLLANEAKASSMTEHALHSLTDFCQSGSISSLGSAIIIYPQVFSRRTINLDGAVSSLQEYLQFPASAYPDRPQLQSRLCACLLTLCLASGQPQCIAKTAGLRLQPSQWHGNQVAEASNLAQQIMEVRRQLLSSGDVTDLDCAALLFEEALCMLGEQDPVRCNMLKDWAVMSILRFRRTSQGYDLDGVGVSLEEMMRLLPTTTEFILSLVGKVSDALLDRFKHTTQAGDLEKAILMSRKGLTLCPVHHPDLAFFLSNLGSTVMIRFQQTGQARDLEEAISLHRESLMLCPAPHPDRSMFLNNFASAVLTRFEQTGKSVDLEEAISLYRDALMLCPPPDPLRSISLNNLGSAAMIRFQQTGQAADLEEAILLHQESLMLCPAPHPLRSTSLSNLASAVLTRFKQTGQVVDLEKAISLYRESLVLFPALHPLRSKSLNNLGNAARTRFQQTGQTVDLEEAISLHRECLMLCPALHPLRSVSLSNLASAILTRFQQTGQVIDLDEAISFHRESLVLRPAPHPLRSISLSNLASAILMRFQQTAKAADLEEAISHHRESLMLFPAMHPDRSMSLNNVASAVMMRFEKTRQVVDLEEAISLYRDALILCPAPHPLRSKPLNNLGSAVMIRFQQTGQAADLEEAISLRESLSYFSLPHIPITGQEVDLEEAILLHRDALILYPASHPDRSMALNNLAKAVTTRFEETEDIEDYNEAILLRRQALECLPKSHTLRCHMLIRLASSLLKKRSSSDSSSNDILNTAIDLFRTAVRCEPASVLDRLNAARVWAYRADELNHTSALEAYQAAIHLYPLVSMLVSSIKSRHEHLAHKLDSLLPTDAAACAIRRGQFEQAVELLEEGRAVFWTQALKLRTPLDDLYQAHPELAKRFQEMSQALERSSFHNNLGTIGDDARGVMRMEAEAAGFRRLHEDWLATLERIRALTGFEEFMHPKKFTLLKRAASRGPVILLNAAKSSCDALIVTSAGVQHVPISTDFTRADSIVLVNLILRTTHTASATFPHGLLGPLNLLVQNALNRSHITSSEHHHHRGVRPKAPLSQEDVFSRILVALWTFVVQPVICALKLKRSEAPARVWWCPAGPLAFLPIHAAGIYIDNLGRLEDTSDYMISSYTPTLNALLVAPPTTSKNPFKILVTIQPEAPGCSPLFDTQVEMDKIEARVPASSLIKQCSSSASEVLSCLLDVSIAHFACHGIQNPSDPLSSALILHDGPLEISKIMEMALPNASLAFLSACQTAKGDTRLADEATHLAGTMLFSGFRGVVGTMWSMHDSDGPTIVDEFYGHLFDGCHDGSRPDTMQAARALHLAVKKLRANLGDKSFLRWVPFVHYGL